MTAIQAIAATIAGLLALAATGLMAAADTAVRDTGRARARRLAESGVRGGVELDRLAERPGRLSAARSLVTALAAALFVAVAVLAAERALAGITLWLALPLAFLAAWAVFFAFAEGLARTVAQADPEAVGLAVAPAAAAVVAMAHPLARALAAPWVGAARRLSRGERHGDPWSEPPVLAEDSDGSGPDAGEEELLDAVGEFVSTIVREVMVPRTDMVCLPDDATLPQAVSLATESGFSRLPVYHETLDDIRGVIYAKDLLACLGRADCPATIEGLAHEALFVPETKAADMLLREMRRRAHIAIVADEYGGTAGLVTIEDLLEELVGEIFDEYDPQVALVTRDEDGTYSLDARLPVSEVNERFGTTLDPEADTLGGLLAELAGHIPEVGESFEVEGLRFEVVEREGARLRLVRLTATGTEPPAEEAT